MTSPPAFDPSAAAAPESGLFGLDTPPQEARVHVLGVPWDATASYRKGAWRGPEAILRASHQVDLYDLVTGKPYEAGIALIEPDPEIPVMNRQASERADVILEVGGDLKRHPELRQALERVEALGATLNDKVYQGICTALDDGRIPFVMGGDHSVPFGAIRAAAERNPGLGILHVDAHADLREAYESFRWSHASIFHNVATWIPDVEQVLQVGVRDLCAEEHEFIRSSGGRFRTLWDHEWAAARNEGRDLRALVRDRIADLPESVWISFDVDGLDPSLCPNTGTPVPGGLDWHGAMLLLEELAKSGRRVVGGDLCEVNPGANWSADLDGDTWDAIVGARLLYRLIGFALKSCE